MMMNRPTGVMIATLLMMPISNLAQAADDKNAGDKSAVTVFMGTYTRGWACPPPAEKGGACTSKGIYSASFDPATGTLGTPTLVVEADNPSYLALHPSGKYLYVANEVGDWKGDKQFPQTGAISAYAVDPAGKLKLINQLSSHGADPCHVSLTAGGKHVLVANYSGGTVASYLVGPGGELKEGSVVKDAGEHGPHKNQDAAHAHFVTEGPKPGLVYVADLGLDKILLYDLDAAGKLVPHAAQPFATLPPGSGPRHLAIHPSGTLLLTNAELTSAIGVFKRDPGTGALSPPALPKTMSTVPAGHKGRSDNAALQLSRDGRFAYVSNRGHDSITVFAVNPASGKLKTVQTVPSGGKEPRDFQFDPSGAFILVGHQISDEVVVFRVDPRTGKLTKTGSPVKVSKPVNFAFWKPTAPQ